MAAILKAATAVIAEKGYEGATMAEIAARSGTKIGSLYRFFPNKESVADTILVSARENIEAMFDKFEADVSTFSVPALADKLVTLLLKLFSKLAFMKLLDASPDWSLKREEFRAALLRRIAKTLTIHSPNLSKKSAGDMALVVLLNVKSLKSNQAMPDFTPSTTDEFRDMTLLYLQSRLDASSTIRTTR